MAGMFAAWPRRVLIAFVAVAGCLTLFLFASAVVKAEQMVASWYGPGFEGATTASGEPFDPSDYTAAHKTYEFGTRLIVTYEGRSVVVRVNDRGPYVAGRDLDLSQGAAEYIGLTSVGVATVNVETAAPGTPTGPYGGTRKVRREAPADQQDEPVRDTRQTSPDNEQAETSQQEKARQDFVGVGEDQYASEDQYDASADQYNEENVVEEAIPPAPPAPKPVVPVLPPEPEPAELESPPAELAVPNSTIERRVELKVAATPAPTPAPEPEQPAQTAAAEPIVQEEPEPAAEEEPVVEEEPVAEEKSVVEEKPEKSEDTGPGGITVLPDTGGAPVGVLVGGMLLLGAGIVVRIVRR